jgi:ParB-like chromosome segregation protein Spo0J
MGNDGGLIMEKLALGRIKTNGGTQPRKELDQQTVQEYAEAMERGDTFPELLIYFDGSVYWLVDGFHRYHAYKQIKQRKVPCIIKQGTHREAVLASVGVNAKHGLRRTNEDKRRAIMVLLEDREWSRWSDSEIARRCNVNQTTVSKYRKTSPMENIGENRTRIYTDKHGNQSTMDTSNLGRKPAESESPDLLEKLDEVNKAIASGKITNRQLEGTRKAIDKRGVDKQRQKEVKDQLPKKTRIRLLNDKMASIADELQYLAEGTIEPEEGDHIWIKAIKMKAPSFIWMFHKMGVDLNQVYSTLINPGHTLDNQTDDEGEIIDITPERKRTK